jgi:hypothetical protein
MKHWARVYLSIAFFPSLVVVISPLFATGFPSASTQASSDRGAAIFRKSSSVCHRIRPGETKVGPSLYEVLRMEFYEKVRGTLSKRYGKQLRMAKARCPRSGRS